MLQCPQEKREREGGSEREILLFYQNSAGFHVDAGAESLRNGLYIRTIYTYINRERERAGLVQSAHSVRVKLWELWVSAERSCHSVIQNSTFMATETNHPVQLEEEKV